jgi:hypothetical protein
MMPGRQVALYFAWSRPDEIAAPLGVLEDRFPALFELRRLFWPRFEEFADPAKFDQSIGGFLDNIARSKRRSRARIRKEKPPSRQVARKNIMREGARETPGALDVLAFQYVFSESLRLRGP